jgi:hypothetical protein
LFVALACAVAQGCSGAAPALPSSGDSANAPVQSPLASFEIFSLGGEPRRPMRYAVRVDMSEFGTDELTARVIPRVGDHELPEAIAPPVHQRFARVATRVTPDDHVMVRSQVLSLDVLPHDDADPRIVASHQELLPRRVGTSQESEVTRQGEVVLAIRRAAATMDSEDSEELDQRWRAERAAAFAFPADPIGEGARWRATRTISDRGITSVGTIVAPLAHVAGDRFTTELTFEVHATADHLDQAPPAGQQFRLRTSTKTGTVTSTEDLTSLVPVSQVTDAVTITTFDLAGVAGPLTVTLTSHHVVKRQP